MDKKKKKVMLTPCPSYDIAGTEGWLEEMAGAGWLLCKDSIFGIWATFEPRDPGDTRPVRYRLDPAGEATGWIFGSSRPDGEKAEGYREMGWEYVTFHGEFYLYRTFDPEAVELNTDPAVQALALKKVGSQMKGQLFSLIFWLVIYPLAGLGGFLLTAALLLGTPFFAVFTLSFLLSVYCNLRGIIHLRKVRRQLRAGEPLRAAVRPRKKARRYQAVWAADLLLTAVWVLMAVGYWKADLDGDFTHLLAGYVEEIDVPTLAALDVDGEPVYYEWTTDSEGTVEIHSDWLLGTVYSTEETGAATLSDGRVFHGGLYVDYIEASSPWIARTVAREYVRYDRWKNRWTLFRQESDWKELPLPDLGVDYAVAYTDIFPTVVLAEGDKAVKFYFYDTNESVDYVEMAEIYAEALKNG